MKFRAGVPVSEILGVCRPFLFSAPDPSSLPDSIGSLEPPESSTPDSLTMVGDRVPLKVRESLRAALVLVEPAGAGSAYGKARADKVRADKTGPSPSEARTFGGAPVLVVSSLHPVLAALIEAFEDRFLRPAPFADGSAGAAGGNLVSSTAVVDGILEGGVTVGAGACIGSGSYVGSGTRIGPNAVIHAHCRIGRDCDIQAGAVIGAPGFGFFPGEAGEGLRAMPHAGGVEIGDRCRVGANTVIAAGVLGPTVLGSGSQVDSLVQIAHNVRIGEGALIASQCGIAGSTVVGRRFRMGGSAGLNDHLRIGDDVTVAAFSGVTKDLPDGITVAGFPARPIAEWRRQEIHLKHLGRRP